GPHLHDVEWMACLKALAAVDHPIDLICASGILPPGAPADFYARAAQIAEMKGVPCILDASGPALKAALGQHVRLIKPNLAELRELVPGAWDDVASLVADCRSLITSGRTESVALTLGERGALLVTSGA